MKQLNRLHVNQDQLVGSWCNSDAVVSCAMEAVSFITPVVERFFIRTVAQALVRQHAPELGRCARKFMLEEANHARAHRRFNAALFAYLGSAPPGLAMARWLLAAASQRMSLSNRLLLAATLEHFSAVLSRRYLLYEDRWSFCSSFAKTLFAQHAREELAHRAVAFDLWRSRSTDGRRRRFAALLAVLILAWAYLAVAVPWILYRKSGRRLSRALVHLTKFIGAPRSKSPGSSPVGELFLFTRLDFHPRLLPFESPL